MSLNEINLTLNPSRREAFGLIVALVVGAAMVIVGLLKLDDRIASISRLARVQDAVAIDAHTLELVRAAALVEVANANALDKEQDRRIKALEDQGQKQGDKLDKVLDAIGDVRADVRVMRATYPRR